ncbi:MAG: GerMN domain-containing protein [Patescibacteria group bacterium]
MRNILIILLIGVIVVILGLMITNDGDNGAEYSVDEAREIAKNWMESESPTYVFDGSDLEIEEEEELDEDTFEFTFNFQSSSAGFGDREEEMTAQVITPHTTVVTVEEGEVVSAVTDDVYSELEDEMIEDGDSESREISVYFMTVEDGQEDIVSVEREVSGEERIEVLALEELLAGPTEEEEDQGYSTAINEGVEILDFSIQEGTAQVDFSSELDEGVAGSATVLAIRAQIENTLVQFDPIDDVVIMVEGEEEGVLQP